MPLFVNKDNDVRAVSTADDLEKALGEGYGASSVSVKDPVSGHEISVPAAQAVGYLRRGFSTPGIGESMARARQTENEEKYGGALDKIQTGGESALSTLSGGLYPWLLTDENKREMRDRSEVNPGSALTGDIVGAGVGLLAGELPGGGFTPLGRLGRVAEGAGELAGERLGTSLGAKLLAKGAQTATEGAGLGLVEGSHELGLEDGPLSAEHVIGTLGEKALYGGAIGGALGIAGKAAELGIHKGAKAVAEYAESIRNNAAAAADPMSEVATMDVPTLREARSAEVENAKVARKESIVQEGKSIVDGLRDYHQGNGSDLYLAIEDQQAGINGKQMRRMRDMLDEPQGLSESPGRALDPLRRQAKAIEETIGKKDELLDRLAKKDVADANHIDFNIKNRADDVMTMELEPKLAQTFSKWKNAIDPEAAVKVRTGKGLTVGVDDAREFEQALRAGDVNHMRTESLDKLPQILEQNRAIQDRISALADKRTADLVTPRLQEIQARLDEISSGGGKKSFGQELLGLGTYKVVAGVVGHAIGGPLGAVGGFAAAAAAPVIARRAAQFASDVVLGRMGRASAETVGRISGALDAFAAGASASEPVAPMGAHKILTSTSFGVAAGAEGVSASHNPTVTAFRQREAEIRSQTEPAPDGTMQMRPAARAKVADRLKAVAVAHPILADQLETKAAGKIAYLASKLPKRPDTQHMQLGPDTWRPSDMEISSFARTVRAVQDPVGVIERLNHGSVTPEDAEAMQRVYPEMFNKVKVDILKRLPEMQKSGVSYKKKLALTIFTGVPMDAAFSPMVMQALQASFESEPGTEGGTQAPRAQPQFGSVSKPEPTPAQERAG